MDIRGWGFCPTHFHFYYNVIMLYFAYGSKMNGEHLSNRLAHSVLPLGKVKALSW